MNDYSVACPRCGKRNDINPQGAIAALVGKTFEPCSKCGSSFIISAVELNTNTTKHRASSANAQNYYAVIGENLRHIEELRMLMAVMEDPKSKAAVAMSMTVVMRSTNKVIAALAEHAGLTDFGSERRES